MRTQWSSLVYSDNRGIGLSNASNHTLLAGVDVSPWPFLTVSPLAGYRWDRQGAIHDRGLSLDLGAEVHPLDLDGYRFSGDGQFRRDMLSPRVLENHIARAGVEKQFSPESRDSLTIGFQQTGREFYFNGDSSIESRSDGVFSFSNLLSYDVSRTLGADVFVHGQQSRTGQGHAASSGLLLRQPLRSTRASKSSGWIPMRRRGISPRMVHRRPICAWGIRNGAKHIVRRPLPGTMAPNIAVLFAETEPSGAIQGQHCTAGIPRRRSIGADLVAGPSGLCGISDDPAL